MEHGNIVFRFLAPPDENPPKAVHPTMRPFHDPTPRSPARRPLDPLGFLSLGGDVRREAKLLDSGADFVIRVPFIQT